jgi:DNA mismatch repair protein MutS2
VVPVKNEYRSEVKGFIHDISSSGSTVFIEPVSIFDLNNDLNNLKNDENIEIERILMNLSSLFFELSDSLQNNINLIGIIDFIFAKAKYSNYLDAVEPSINSEKVIDLKSAWHPLIDKKVAVKNDITLGKAFNNLIITGPNTGGKTVTLKTVGLLVVMAMSGMHIPAKEGSSIYIFDNVFADIGDEQSIADSLSTFSSHMVTIANILKNATSDSLVLLDELGSGTDPIQGSCLAISILEELNKREVLNISTTHYPELKHYALVNDNFENASVEFNIDTLSPTYKLLVGVPGSSNAFVISQKLGISEDIISRANELLTSDEISIEELLKNIYEDKKEIENEKQKTIDNSKAIEEIKLKLENDFSSLKKQEQDIINEAKVKARDILLDAKEDANEIIREIEKSANTREINNSRNKLNSKIEDLAIIKNSSDKDAGLKPEAVEIGMSVYIPTLNQQGSIVSVKNKKACVQIGLMKTYFNFEDLQRIDRPIKKEKEFKHTNRKEFKPKMVMSEINVIGQNVDEACFAIDKYLDDCALNGLNTTRIVHGKGTGALRNGIHKFLKTHPHVKSFRVGTFGEGEMGVTIVEIK